jgi:hypothetical protein
MLYVKKETQEKLHFIDKVHKKKYFDHKLIQFFLQLF